ncbi:methanogenesis marker 16 metalloprotein [Leisingera sp. S232]|uniref:methanogenesis marker 16 metalloprotein n=1 Tax=Leisingera sp. S232 TaxID=3415132 RepID=UPI003C7BB68F
MTNDHTNGISRINERLKRGDAVVMTAQEFKSHVRSGHKFQVGDVDVVTTATHGIMSGTAASFSIPVAPPGSFERAAAAWINGVPAQPGPAPNERLGSVDLMVYGTTANGDTAPPYGGGHLFRDLVERQECTIEVLSTCGKRLKRRFTLDDLGFARIYSMRNAFKSYMAFGNFRSTTALRSIFSVWPMTATSGLTVIGSGEMNPIQNDPNLNAIGIGSLAMINNAPGVVIGSGTLAYSNRPNLSLAADMFDMDPYFMGGVCTSEGVEVLNAVSIPIPIVDDAALQSVIGALDENLVLPVADVNDRQPFDEMTYGDVWQGPDHDLTFDPSKLDTEGKDIARAAAICPVNAVDVQAREIDRTRCIRCGACTVEIDSDAFSMNMGTVDIGGKEHPITFRTSDRFRAMELAESLKSKILSGDVPIRDKLLDITCRQPSPLAD